MNVPLTIPTIIQIAKICQYQQAVAIGRANALKGGIVDQTRANLIYLERQIIEDWYGLSPNDPALPGAANYLFSLLDSWQLAQQIANNQAVAGPVITGPANQSVNAGATATFSVTVSGVSPFTYQWFDYLGNLIAGATSSSYAFTNAQLSDSGKTFFVKVTDANGKQSTSGVATLTVAAVLTGFLSYQASDPSATLQASSDPFTYQESFSITSGQPWVMPVPGASTPNMYIIVKGPIGQPIKTAWNNGGVNTGLIPDLNWHPTLAFGGFQYYYTHLISLDPLQTLTLS